MTTNHTEDFIYTWDSILRILPISISRRTLFRRYAKPMLQSGAVVKQLKGRGKRPTVSTTKERINQFFTNLNGGGKL